MNSSSSTRSGRSGPASFSRPAAASPGAGSGFPRIRAFEVLLIATLIVGWADAGVRIALIVALLSHAAMRIWSLVDFVPKAVEFEKTDPAVVDEAAAVRWTRRSLLRLPLDVITCAAMLAALVSAAG